MSEPVVNEMSPEKVIRTQERLSAMIESLGEVNHDPISADQDQDDMQSLSSMSSSDQFEPLRPPQIDVKSIHTPPDQKLPSSSSISIKSSENTDNIEINDDNNEIASNNSNHNKEVDSQMEFLPPPIHAMNNSSMGASPSSTETRNNSNITDNRYSMMSDYSGVIHEGTEVSYVVKNQDPELIQSASSSSPSLSSASSPALSKPLIQKDIVIKQIKNAKPVSRFNSVRSIDTPSKPPRGNLKYHSDPLLLIHDQTREKLNDLSIGSSIPTIRNDDNGGTPGDDNMDSFSIQSSVVPPLTTTTGSQDKFIEPTRSEINNNIIPTVPPRNKNRPRTVIFDEDDSSSLSPQQTSPKRSQKRQQQQSKSSNKNNNSKDFNAHTISQLLSMTNGTLIGSEFQDLPVPVEEKRALERLVDSLSRLTADMVLDPERYEEGLVRLKSAIRALEGFK